MRSSAQYRVDRLIMRYGIDAKLFQWSDEITAAPRKAVQGRLGMNSTLSTSRPLNCAFQTDTIKPIGFKTSARQGDTFPIANRVHYPKSPPNF
jgi:hypothetical protein